jgi:phosphatidylcholine synthase
VEIEANYQESLEKPMQTTLSETSFANAKSKLYILRSWAVHIYTSLGLITGFLSVGAILSGEPKLAFIFLALSCFIDSTDGTLARAWKIKTWLPQFDGRKLDDITDYLNYTFIPVLFLYHFNMVPGAWMAILPVVLVTSAYGFCQDAAKTADGYFTGFPNYWNFLVFYLYVFKTSPLSNAIILLVFSGLIFVPIKYVSFSTRPLRRVTLAVTGLFGVVLLMVLLRLENPDWPLVWFSLFGPLYVLLVSLYLQFGRRKVIAEHPTEEAHPA